MVDSAVSVVKRSDFVQPSLLVPPLQRDLSLLALETVQARVSDVDVSPVVLVDYDNVPASALPALAEQTNLLGDAGWDFANFGPSSELKKRSLLKIAVPLQGLRGTRYAIEQAMAAMGVSTKITEWWQESPRGKPYTFKVDLLLSDGDAGQPIINKAKTDALIRTVTYWKNVRSHFQFRVGAQYGNNLRVANTHQRQMMGRWACEALPVRPRPCASELQVAGVMARGLQVLRLTMDLTIESVA